MTVYINIINQKPIMRQFGWTQVCILLTYFIHLIVCDVTKINSSCGYIVHISPLDSISLAKQLTLNCVIYFIELYISRYI